MQVVKPLIVDTTDDGLCHMHWCSMCMVVPHALELHQIFNYCDLCIDTDLNCLFAPSKRRCRISTVQRWLPLARFFSRWFDTQIQIPYCSKQDFYFACQDHNFVGKYYKFSCHDHNTNFILPAVFYYFFGSWFVVINA